VACVCVESHRWSRPDPFATVCCGDQVTRRNQRRRKDLTRPRSRAENWRRTTAVATEHVSRSRTRVCCLARLPLCVGLLARSRGVAPTCPSQIWRSRTWTTVGRSPAGPQSATGRQRSAARWNSHRENKKTPAERIPTAWCSSNGSLTVPSCRPD
jgi:hypothetical protein